MTGHVRSTSLPHIPSRILIFPSAGKKMQLRDEPDHFNLQKKNFSIWEKRRTGEVKQARPAEVSASSPS